MGARYTTHPGLWKLEKTKGNTVVVLNNAILNQSTR